MFAEQLKPLGKGIEHKPYRVLFLAVLFRPWLRALHMLVPLEGLLDKKIERDRLNRGNIQD